MANEMRATFSDGLWEVTDSSGRCWTATGSGPDANICNEKLTNIKPGGVIGTKVRHAIMLEEKVRNEG